LEHGVFEKSTKKPIIELKSANFEEKKVIINAVFSENPSEDLKNYSENVFKKKKEYSKDDIDIGKKENTIKPSRPIYYSKDDLDKSSNSFDPFDPEN
jgi:hypothetical protein